MLIMNQEPEVQLDFITGTIILISIMDVPLVIFLIMVAEKVILNITWQEVAGIRLGEKRSVYGVSIDNEIGYIKTVYINESMEFDLDMADELFSIAGVQ